MFSIFIMLGWEGKESEMLGFHQAGVPKKVNVLTFTKQECLVGAWQGAQGAKPPQAATPMGNSAQEEQWRRPILKDESSLLVLGSCLGRAW